MNIKCEISLGELIDKISILKIKRIEVKDEYKLSLVIKEEKALLDTLQSLELKNIEVHLQEMLKINQKLWKIEDSIRDKERAKEFDEDFIQLARSVYIVNDERFKKKNNINIAYNSNFSEVKSYQDY